MSWKNVVESGDVRETTPARGRRPWSLAAQFRVAYCVSAFVVLAVACGLLYWELVSLAIQEDEQDLSEKISVVSRMLRDGAVTRERLKPEVEWEPTAQSFSPILVRVLLPDGRVLAETPGMSSVLPASAFTELRRKGSPSEGMKELRSPTERPFCGRAATVSAGAEAYIIEAAIDRTGEEALFAGYRHWILIVLGSGLAACAFIGHSIARRGLRPLQQMAGAVQQIRSTTLNERLKLPGLPAELSALATTFNEMLDRLEEAFTRLSRFSADIAHELRTPIHNLRGEVEVALSKPRSPGDYEEALHSALEECQRLSRMIDSLLFLARTEVSQITAQRQPVDVAQELEKLREFYEPAAGDAGIALELSAPPDLVADLDGTLVQRAIANLIENALAHTPRGGRIGLRASSENHALRIEVSDTGCGIAAEHLPHIFDNFYRVDSARSKQTGGLGLGLAIVKGIATLHGGAVHLQSQTGKGTTVTLTFPLHRTPRLAITKS